MTEVRRAAVPLAWCGWRLDLPRDWRPLRFTGVWRGGAVLVGTSEEAVFSVEWTRPDARRFVPREWVEARAARLKGRPQAPAPRPDGFDPVAFVTRPPSRTALPNQVWIAWHAGCRLGLTLTLNGTATEAAMRTALEDILPSLSATPLDAPTPWAAFEASFLSPPRFTLSRWRLFSGDIALEWIGPSRRRMCVRQVYPACIALARRPLAAWIADYPFVERRRVTPIRDPTPRSFLRDGVVLEGLALAARRALPFPLHRVGATDGMAVAVRDTALDRLLLTYCYAPGDEAEPLARAGIAGMNWALRDATKARTPEAGLKTPEAEDRPMPETRDNDAAR
jgi:hypothetical protein